MCSVDVKYEFLKGRKADALDLPAFLVFRRYLPGLSREDERN
jgi:hypothetical protein